MKQIKQKLFVIFMILTVAFGGIYVYGTSESELRKQIAEAEKRLEETQKELSEARKKQASAQKQKEIIDKQVSEIVANILYIDGQIETANNQIAEKEQEIIVAQENLDKNKEYFKKRVTSMYKSGTTTYLEMLFNSDSIGDFFGRMDMIQYVVRNDKKIVDDMTAARDEIIDAKKVIEERKVDLLDAKAANEKQQESLSVALAEQTKIVGELNKNVQSFEAAAAKAEQEKQALNLQLERELAGLTDEPGTTPAYTGGKMQWPVPAGGRISSPYGYRTYPAAGLHTGIDIAIGMGNTIAAAEAGTVIKVVNGTTGYGKYLMINHGNGTVTLYAHSSKIVVSVGQQVARGQKIAEIGSTGFSTGPHLHFEVRIDGKAVNPIGYIQ